MKKAFTEIFAKGRSGHPRTPLSRPVWAVSIISGMVIGTYFQYLIGVLPFSVHTFFVLLAGFVLGPLFGPITMALFIGAGALGLPIFAVGQGGIGHLMGPTGGYIFGWLFAVCLAGCAGMFTKRTPMPWGPGIATALLALIPVYALGLPWLKYTLDIPWPRTLARGLVIFLPGEALKVVAVVWVYRLLERKGLVEGKRET